MNKLWNFLRKLLPERKTASAPRPGAPARTAVSPSRRFTSGLLAFVMVLGFLPGGLFELLPKARAAGDLAYTVSITKSGSNWNYTVTFSGGSPGGNLGNVYFALVPDYSSSGPSMAPSNQIGSFLNNGQAAVGAFETILHNLMGDKTPHTGAVQKPTDKRYDANGQVQFTGTIPDSYYQELKTLYASQPGKFGHSATDAIPMCVVMTNFGDPKYVSGGPCDWQEAATVTPANLTSTAIRLVYADNGDGTFTYLAAQSSPSATVTNLGDRKSVV